MTEENKLPKMRNITVEELMDIIDEYSGVKIARMPANTQILARIVDAPQVKSNDTKEYGTLTNYIFPVEYRIKGQDVALRFFVGENAYKRFIEKYPNLDDYKGKYAFFSKTLFQGNNPQFINVIQKEGFEPTEFKSAKDKINEIHTGVSTESDTVSQTDVQEFVTKFLENVSAYNEKAAKEGAKPITASAEKCALSFFKTMHKQTYERIVEVYGNVTQ